MCERRSVRICCHDSPHDEAVDPRLRPFHTVSRRTRVNKGSSRLQRLAMPLIHVASLLAPRSTRSGHGRRTRQVLISQGVEDLVEYGTLFDRTPAHRPPSKVEARSNRTVEPHALISAVPVIVICSAPYRLSRLHDARWFVSTARHCQSQQARKEGRGSCTPPLYVCALTDADLRRTALDIAF
jgi:hypothetical protein